MRIYARKTTPRVKSGKVQQKNRLSQTPNYYNTPQQYPIIDRQKPGWGWRHLIRKKDLSNFINILPEWNELSKGLDAIILASGNYGMLGWHDYGVIGICAWDREIVWDDCDEDFYNEHKEVFEKLNIPCVQKEKLWVVSFDEAAAKAFQLIHVFIHELGHHHDRMTTRSKENAARGEEYAENYAKKYEDIIIDLYQRNFRY